MAETLRERDKAMEFDVVTQELLNACKEALWVLEELDSISRLKARDLARESLREAISHYQGIDL